MFSDVPNLAIAIGYTNASWTLKCDLTCEYVCRLLNHMDKRGYDQCTPRNDDADGSSRCRSSTSPRATSSARSTSSRSRARSAPWKLHQNYALDIVDAALRRARRRRPRVQALNESVHVGEVREHGRALLGGLLDAAADRVLALGRRRRATD